MLSSDLSEFDRRNRNGPPRRDFRYTSTEDSHVVACMNVAPDPCPIAFEHCSVNPGLANGLPDCRSVVHK